MVKKKSVRLILLLVFTSNLLNISNSYFTKRYFTMPSTVFSIILPMSSSSDVIDLERRAMAGGVSLLVCCGAAVGSQPDADLTI